MTKHDHKWIHRTDMKKVQVIYCEGCGEVKQEYEI